MILLKMLGLVPKEAKRSQLDIDEEEIDQIQDSVNDAAEAMVRAGVKLSVAEWLEMTANEKAAWVKARNAIADEQAVKIGRCVFDLEFRAQLEARYNGGASLREFRKMHALMALSQKMDEVGRDRAEHLYVKP